MTKIESLYHELLKIEVATTKDIEEAASKILKGSYSFKYIYNEYLSKLKMSGKLLHPRRGLYIAVPPLMIGHDNFQPDRYLVASKIQEPYYLGYHTALEIHGTAYSKYNEVYIVVPPDKKFREFEFKDINYRPVYNSSSDLGLQKVKHKEKMIVTSSPGRTFIDCIDRPEYSGGWEECLKGLESLPGVKSKEIKNMLEVKEKDILYRKTGLILSFFTENPYYEGVLSELEPYLKEKIGTSPMYLSRDSKSYLDEEWMLYVPKGFRDLLRGV